MRFLLLFMLVIGLAQGQNLKVAITVEDNVLLNTSYDNICRITNTDYIKGNSYSINTTFYYNLSTGFEDEQEINGINYYKRVGNFTICAPQKFRLCCWLLSNDSNLSDNLDCLEIAAGIENSVEDTSCGVSISTDKDVFVSGEKVGITHITDCTDFEIDYWIEDIEGNIAKEHQITSNLNRKSWTKKIDCEEKAFILKARIGNMTSGKLIAIKGKAEQILEITSLSAKSGKVAKLGIRSKGIGGFKIEAKGLLPEPLEIDADGEFELPLSRGECGKEEKLYKIKVEGGGMTDSEELRVEKCPAVERFEIIGVSQDNRTFGLSMNFTSAEEGEYEFLSFIYRGSKKFSEEESVVFDLEAGESRTIALSNIINSTTGSYAQKVRYRNTAKKTYKEEKRDIFYFEDKTAPIIPTIKSFYTLQKKPKDTIRLFAALSNPSEILLFSVSDTTMFSNSSEYGIDARLLPGNNTFLLLLLHNGTVVDFRTLDYYSNITTAVDIKVPIGEESAPQVSNLTEITGGVIYDSDDNGGYGLIAFGGAAVLGLGALVFRFFRL